MNEKLKQFYDVVSKNPNIKGIPASYEEFATAMSDSNVSNSFYKAISQNPNIKGLPSTYDEFASGLGLKKKEPTQGSGRLGVTPSPSASSGSLTERLAAAPPIPKGATVDVPMGGVPKRIQEQRIEVAQPPIGNVPLQPLEEREAERQQLYEPSQVSKRLSNLAVEFDTVLPAIDAWQRSAGQALFGKFSSEQTNEAERAMMIAQEINLQDLESRLQEGTEGSIIGSIKKGDLPALAYGIFDASMGVLRSGVVGGATFGGGLIPDMMAQTTRSFNKAKAESLGLTPDQLIEQGKEEVAIPSAIGAMGGALELVGLKGITGAITQKVATKAGKQIATSVLAMGGEGSTEWLQAGLEKANESLAQGKSVEDASKDAVSFMFSEEGAEAALKGVAGAGGAIAVSKGVRLLVDAKEKLNAGQPLTAAEVQEIAVADIESGGAVSAALDNLAAIGGITQEQRDAVAADIDAMAAAYDKVPAEFAANAATIAPIILQKQGIDAEIAAKTAEKMQVDEAFHSGIDEQINALEAQKKALNEQIQAIATTNTAIQEMTSANQEAILSAVNTLGDNETRKFKFAALEDVPSAFRDRAKKTSATTGTNVDYGKGIRGLFNSLLGINGKVSETKGAEFFEIEVSGKELRDLANVQQATTQQEETTPTQNQPTPTQVGEVAEPTQAEGGGVVEGVQADSVEQITPQANETETTIEEASPEGSVLAEVRDGGTQDEGGQEGASLRTQEEITQTQDNAAEQQSGTLREASVQVEPEGAGNSDMSSLDEAELQDGQEPQSEEQKQKVINAGGIPAAKLLNSEGNLPEARQKLSDYLKDMPKEVGKVLNKAANKQALKLVNEAQTEKQMDRAIEYIDKLIKNQSFRDAVEAASDAVDKAPDKLSRYAQMGNLVKAIANIKVRGIDDVALLKKMAEILSNPKQTAPFQLQELVNEVNDYLIKKADPKGLGTQEDVLKAFKNATTEKAKDADGKTITQPKALDTARKIKNQATRIAEIEAAMVDTITDEDVLSDLRTQIEAEKNRINDASDKLKAEMAVDRDANIRFVKEIVRIAQNTDMFSKALYEASIKPIQQTDGWENQLEKADYYTSVKYRNAFENVALGYVPRYFFREVTVPLTNFGKVDATIKIAEAATPKQNAAAKVLRSAKSAFAEMSTLMSDAFGLGTPKDKDLVGDGKQLTKEQITKKIQAKHAQYIDAMYGLENEAVFLDNFVAPTQNAFENKDTSVQNVMNRFYKEAGITQATMALGTARNAKLESFYKTFYYLLQQEANANGKEGSNVLKEQLAIIKDSKVKSSIPDFKLAIIERIDKKYPKGVTEDNLTAKEKKMVAAYKNAIETLRPLQEQANIRRGLDFNPVAEYVPHTGLEYGFTARDMRGETVDFDQTNSMLSDTGNVDYKKPKIRSDRGISRVENATPFVYNPDLPTILGIAANDVMTDYYLFPQIYSAQRALSEASKTTGSAMPDALRTRYEQMIKMQGAGFKGKVFRAVGGILRAAYANVLMRPIRIAQEMVGGFFNYKATGKHGKLSRLPKDVADAIKLSAGNGYKELVDLAKKDAYSDVIEFEETQMEKTKSIGKKVFDLITSPDALNDSSYRRTHMVSAMRDKFKEITGEDISFTKATTDPDYKQQYADALKEAAKYAYNQTYVKYYSSARLSRPARPLSIKGHFLYDMTTQGDVALLADKMLFVFGQYAHRMSQLFHSRFRDAITDNNYGRTMALSSVGGFLMTAVSYQLVKEFRNYFGGDDEEKKKAEYRFKTTLTSPDYYIAQLTSAFSFFAMGQYGSIGRGMAYLAAYQYSRALKQYEEKFGTESLAEFKATERAMDNAIKDLTFYQLPKSDYAFKDSWLQVMFGGGAFLAEEASKIINDVSTLAFDAAEGDVDAQKAMYLAGFLYNATLSQRLGLTIPMLKDLKDGEKDLNDQNMTPEALKRKLSKDKKYASQIFEDVALKAALDVVNNRKSQPEAFNDAYKLVGEALPDMDEFEREDKLTKQFNKLLMPTYLHAIDKEQNPEVRGLMFREKRDDILGKLNEAVRVGNESNIDRYEKMQQEMEMYFMENMDNEKFLKGFNSVNGKPNQD